MHANCQDQMQVGLIDPLKVQRPRRNCRDQMQVILSALKASSAKTI